jgi:hypothetical protein
MKKSVGLSFFVVAIFYVGLWFYTADKLNAEIDRLFDSAAENGAEFLGPKPQVANFPFQPQIEYQGGFQMGEARLIFPVMVARGFPFAHTPVHISFPQGVSLGGIVDPLIWSLDFLEAEIKIPDPFPQSVMEEDMRAWQESGGTLEINSFLLKKLGLETTGKGYIGLDDNLQPLFMMESNIKGYEIFIQTMKERNLIESFAAAIGMTMLNSLAIVDADTGEKNINLSVSVKNRILTVGPLQVLELPRISWGTRSPPVLHQ